jgi:hypothetical protein
MCIVVIFDIAGLGDGRPSEDMEWTVCKHHAIIACLGTRREAENWKSIE